MLYAPNKYRETEGTTDQQNSIDRAKGIIAKPMPEYWYSYRAINQGDDNVILNKKIVAPYKPYFMIYVYPTLKSSYQRYKNDSQKKVRRQFKKYGIKTIDDLKDYADKTEEMEEFLKHYESDRKIGKNQCVVNRICWLFEDEFPKLSMPSKCADFDYTILKSPAEYSEKTFKEIKKIYDDYKTQFNFSRIEARLGYNDDSGNYTYDDFVTRFRTCCFKICPNEDELCNIVLDLCYRTNSSKRFAWDVAGDVIIKNLLRKNGYKMSFPIYGGNEFEYNGETFSMVTVTLNGEDAFDNFEREEICGRMP